MTAQSSLTAVFDVSPVLGVFRLELGLLMVETRVLVELHHGSSMRQHSGNHHGNQHSAARRRLGYNPHFCCDCCNNDKW